MISRNISGAYILYNKMRFAAYDLRGTDGKSSTFHDQKRASGPAREASLSRISLLRPGRAGNFGRGLRPADEPVERDRSRLSRTHHAGFALGARGWRAARRLPDRAP